MNVNRKRAPLFYIALSLNVLSVACVPNEPTAIQGKNARTGYQNTNHQNSNTDFQNVCIYDVEHGSETGALSSAKELRGYIHYCHDDQPGISIWQFSEADENARKFSHHTLPNRCPFLELEKYRAST